jgi:hypothetical protein
MIKLAIFIWQKSANSLMTNHALAADCLQNPEHTLVAHLFFRMFWALKINAVQIRSHVPCYPIWQPQCNGNICYRASGVQMWKLTKQVAHTGSTLNRQFANFQRPGLQTGMDFKTGMSGKALMSLTSNLEECIQFWANISAPWLTLHVVP